MDTKFLESLIAVVEAGSIANAARSQGLTAAAVSQRIRVLETELDCDLLSRSAHAAAPTAACLRILPVARALVRDAANLGAHVDASGLSGPYRLGAVSSALLDHIPRIVRIFRDKAPKAELSVRPGTSAALYEDLLDGTLDGVIAVKPPFDLPKKLSFRLVEEQPLVHISPLSRDTGHEGDHILPWIVYDRQSWGGRLIWEECGSRLSSGHVLCELDALETILMMVVQGTGQAIVPLWRGVSEQEHLLHVVPVSGQESVSRKMIFLQKVSSEKSALGDLVTSALQPVA